MPKPEYASRQELREDIKDLRLALDGQRVEFRSAVREELEPLVKRLDVQNGRIGKSESRLIVLEEWQRDRTRIESGARWVARSMWAVAASIISAVFAWLATQRLAQ